MVTVYTKPACVQCNATYKAGERVSPTTGIPYVIINGQIVVKDSKVLRVFAGQPIRYPVEDKGRYEPVSEKDWLLQFPEKYKQKGSPDEPSSCCPLGELRDCFRPGRRTIPDPV